MTPTVTIKFDVDSQDIPQYDPALMAVRAVNEVMNEFDHQYGSKWLTQDQINHAKHAVDHVLNVQNYLISQPDGYYSKVYNLKEEITHGITRLGMLLWLIEQQERASEETPSVALESVATTTSDQQESGSLPTPEVQLPPA